MKTAAIASSLTLLIAGVAQAFHISAPSTKRIRISRTTTTQLHATTNHTDYFDDLKNVLGGGGKFTQNYMDSLSNKNALNNMMNGGSTKKSTRKLSYLDSLSAPPQMSSDDGEMQSLSSSNGGASNQTTVEIFGEFQ